MYYYFIKLSMHYIQYKCFMRQLQFATNYLKRSRIRLKNKVVFLKKFKTVLLKDRVYILILQRLFLILNRPQATVTANNNNNNNKTTLVCALFEPLEPIMDLNGRRPSAESLLPPPDFDSASYPRGWLIGKKRKLVNVDVVESMRRIAVQEMNRKDREIDGLNEQLEEDSRVLEHLQLQLLDERSKRADVERQNALLQNQVDMLMNMLQEPENIEEDELPQDP
ncbi:putative protein heading date repressor 1 [Helianthus annuus]|nr:putative protein heading date repressor 1 [Helianthus annuus]